MTTSDTGPTAGPAAERAALVRAVAEQHVDARGPLLPILHDLTEDLGHLEAEDLALVADVLNVSRAEVHGVVSFYHDFRTTPPAEHRVVLCRGEACQAVGAQELYELTRERRAELGRDVEVEQVFCLGNCALGPSGTVDGRLHGRLDASALTRLTAGWRR
ncbi:MAG: NAD(P)H-dependent oxidoreductase subunit E [Nocardioides sp.]